MISPTTCDIFEETLSDISPRGGATILEIQGKLIIFGGANRSGQNFNDMFVKYLGKSNDFLSITASGEIPSSRSGHAVTKYGKYMILFGGINFVDEIDYNDLFIFDTETFEWRYIGEAGERIRGRNSHSLAIISSNESSSQSSYLVIYGGASSEVGPLDDTYYALLPPHDAIDTSSVYVTWMKLEGIKPYLREMHSTSTANNSVYIIGGRDEDGEILSDVWKLCVCEGRALRWSHEGILQLPGGRCSHGSSVLRLPGDRICLFIFGGFTENGIDSKVLYTVPSDPPSGGNAWKELPVNVKIKGRFGHCMTTLENISNHTTQTNTICIFGGVDVEMDFNQLSTLTIQNI